ncbi:alpha/beta fold hydrolase [Lentzea sp. NBRC 102530]|uniref:alpha/beta fold hydrolase n=1 Tax=Lentzea sp. NBRC 102530 TaxID=3032201 RepID=UPI002557A7B1|nr:alpha/beta fold hydrolase [Lentzea sp. NBRC 102530]
MTLAVPAQASPQPTITWGACADQALAAGGAECGTLAVPLDPAAPNGPEITLAVSRVQHRTAVSKGTVLTVPDPFTGTGYQQPLVGARMAGGDAFDWIGIARRGLAPSVPATTCASNPVELGRPAYVPVPATEPYWTDRIRKIAADCAGEELLDHLKTTDQAADLERVRIALGAPTVSLYAQTYGTYVGQVYQSLNPGRVTRAVYDGSLDPKRLWYHANNFDQDVLLEENQHRWFDFLAAQDGTYHLGASRAAVQAAFDQKVRDLTVQPVNDFGSSEFIDVYLFAAYSEQTWPLLAPALSALVNNNDLSMTLGLYSAFYGADASNRYSALLAQICTDTSWPSDWNKWKADSWATHALAPNSTWGNTWFNGPCAYWKHKPGTLVQPGGTGSALIVNGTLNAVTPFQGSLEVRSRFPNSALLAVANGISFQSTFAGNACVDNAVAAYLANGTLPARKPGRQADATC